MPSPFPGMDPYIESSRQWQDFHNNLITAIQEALNTRLPERYAAVSDVHVWIQEPDAAARTQLRAPNIHVVDQAGRGGTATLEAPAMIVLPNVESQEQRVIQIIDQEGLRIVTALEVLSPSNKRAGAAREVYLTKRNEYLSAGVNLVEIDLLRGGPRLPLGEPPPALADFYVLVCRAADRPHAGFWNIGLRDRLPDVPIPLDPDVPPVLLPLQPCVDHVYDAIRYNTRLRYDDPLTPRLREPDAAWVKQTLAAHRGQPSSSPPPA